MNRASIEEYNQDEQNAVKIKIQKRREEEEKKYESSYKDVGKEVQFHINPLDGLVEKPVLPHLAPSTSALTLNDTENAAKYIISLKTFFKFIDDEILNFDIQIRENLKTELSIYLEENHQINEKDQWLLFNHKADLRNDLKNRQGETLDSNHLTLDANR